MYYTSRALASRNQSRGAFTDLGPHVLKLARDEAAFGVKDTRVGSVLVSMDRRDVNPQKGVGDVADGESEQRVSIWCADISDRTN